MKKLAVLVVTLCALTSFSACKKKGGDSKGKGGKGAAVETVDFDQVVTGVYRIKGKMPKWEKSAGFGGVSVFMLKEKNGMVMAKIEFSSIASGATDAKKFPGVVKAKYEGDLQKIAGVVGEKVEEPTKVRDGVWSYVVKRKDQIMKGYSYEVKVAHLVKFHGQQFALSCQGWARGKKDYLWKSIKKFCAEVQYSEVKKPKK